MGNPEVKQEAGGKRALYQQLVDISLDHNLEQVVNIPTRGENILDLMFTNNRSGLNKVSTLPPLGKTDHDIIYAMVDISVHLPHKPVRKVFLYRKAKWDDLKSRLKNLFQTMCHADPKCSANDLWKQFIDSLIEGMIQYIPQKPISSKHRKPWVNKASKKIIQARNKVYVKRQRSKSPWLRQAYWAYMETIIDFSSPIQRPDDRAPKQRRFWSFIRSLQKDSSGVSLFRSEGEIHSSAGKRLRY